MATAKVARKKAAKRINEAMASSGGKPIGVISYWGLSDVWITVAELRALFKKYDLDEDKWFPPEAQRGSAIFRKALRKARTKQGAKVKGYLLRPIIENDEKIIWGVVREDVDEANADLEYECEAKVAFSKKTESVHCKGKGDALVLAEWVKSVYDDFTKTYVDWDIMRMLKRNIREMDSITLRRGGGFYFTPPQYLPVLEKHQQVIEDIGSSDMGLIVVTEDDKHNKRTVGRDTRRSLEDDLNEVKLEIEKFQTKSPRETTLQDRLESFKALKARCDMYAGILSIKVDDLKQGIDDCAAQIKQIIGQVQLDKAEKKAAKAKEKGEDGDGANGTKTKAKKDLKAAAKMRRVRKVVEATA